MKIQQLQQHEKSVFSYLLHISFMYCLSIILIINTFVFYTIFFSQENVNNKSTMNSYSKTINGLAFVFGEYLLGCSDEMVLNGDVYIRPRPRKKHLALDK